MLRSILASFAIALPLLGACTVGTGNPIPVGDGGTATDTGVKETGTSADGGVKDTGTPPPVGEEACGAEATKDKCIGCCINANPVAAKAFEAVITKCACDSCATECATSTCAVPPKDPTTGDACETCSTKATSGTCRPTIQACANSGPCKPVFSCLSAQDCNSKP
jgi:hypothetical protein